MWKTAKEEEVKCSLVQCPILYLEPLVRRKLELLMEAYPHQEWLAYLTGRSDGGNFFIENVLVPPHSEVSGSSAEAEPFHTPGGCVGIIHSHHSMGAFHSAVDQTYVDKNFPVSVTVSKKSQSLEFDAVSCLVTPCGKGTSGKCKVKYVQPAPLFDEKEFLREADDNISKGKRVFQSLDWSKHQPLTKYQGIVSGVTKAHVGSKKDRKVQKDLLGNSQYLGDIQDESGKHVPLEELEELLAIEILEDRVQEAERELEEAEKELEELEVGGGEYGRDGEYGRGLESRSDLRGKYP